MFSYNRLQEIFTFLASQKGPISPEELARKFHISKRTLRNDIRILNEELAPWNAKILMKRGNGYTLEISEDSLILLQNDTTPDGSLDSVDKRINHIIIYMLYSDDFKTQDDLANEVFVSINTIISYLKTVRLILQKYDLTLKNKPNVGYKIEGSEMNKRNCIIDLVTSNYNAYVSKFSNEQQALLKDLEFEQIQELVTDFNKKNGMHFSDYNLRNLILHIALSVSRIQADQNMESHDFSVDSQTQNLLSPLIECIESTFHTRFSESEKNYIYSHYISNTNELLNNHANIDYVHQIVSSIINMIYELYHFDLRSDYILERDLNHHLQSILNTHYLDLHKKNPLLNTIKNNYILSYEVTETVIKQVFKNEPFDLSDDEIGYISLHIGAAIERYFDLRNSKHKKVMILYDNGYATGSFLSAKISKLFSNNIDIIKVAPSNELEDMDLESVDCIISTVPLSNTKIPCVTVEMPLLRKDIENITRALTMSNMHPVDQIQNFFDPKLFVHTRVHNKKEIIHILCELLRNAGYVDERFEKSVFERENKVSTVMDGVIAIPHPLEMCSLKSKIAIGILDEPIHWSGKDTAQIILMLGLSDESKKDIEKLYDTFVEMMHNPQLQSLLLKTENLNDFLQILKDHISLDNF
ncbi:BglG family transcription antiterminator [Faecalicoccus sp.]|uniref:BglG family transcription antiterminator n=1 Tax=Faecalicoccus sp. TaxID=1971758 RepID=UPI002A8158FF|nr:BglG family transcription antiterminator [Faecalicoccus sp.]MDY5111217.1 BglG family transcription antiterminator [Faecalicoccus sp.]